MTLEREEKLENWDKQNPAPSPIPWQHKARRDTFEASLCTNDRKRLIELLRGGK